jgi:hypothetical protein
MRYSKSKEINKIVNDLVKKHGCVFLYGGKHGALWEFPWKPQHVVL